jgi:hypothetical protein
LGINPVVTPCGPHGGGGHFQRDGGGQSQPLLWDPCLAKVMVVDNPTRFGMVIIIPGEGHGDPNDDANKDTQDNECILFLQMMILMTTFCSLMRARILLQPVTQRTTMTMRIVLISVTPRRTDLQTNRLIDMYDWIRTINVSGCTGLCTD